MTHTIVQNSYACWQDDNLTLAVKIKQIRHANIPLMGLPVGILLILLCLPHYLAHLILSGLAMMDHWSASQYNGWNWMHMGRPVLAWWGLQPRHMTVVSEVWCRPYHGHMCCAVAWQDIASDSASCLCMCMCTLVVCECVACHKEIHHHGIQIDVLQYLGPAAETPCCLSYQLGWPCFFQLVQACQWAHS